MIRSRVNEFVQGGRSLLWVHKILIMALGI